MKLLIVDDSPSMRMIIKQGLKEMNFTDVYQAADGSQGVELFMKHKPDLITMDIQMPVMDGLEAIKRINAEDENSKILVISTITDKHAIRRALLRGAAYYLVKPFTKEKIMETAKAVIFNNQHIRYEFQQWVNTFKNSKLPKKEIVDYGYRIDNNQSINFQRILEIKNILPDLRELIKNIYDSEEINDKVELLELSAHISKTAEETPYDSIKIGVNFLNHFAKDIIKNVRDINEKNSAKAEILTDYLIESIDIILKTGAENTELLESISSSVL